MLRDVLSRFRDGFADASLQSLKDNAFAYYARNDAAEVVKVAIDRPDLNPHSPSNLPF